MNFDSQRIDASELETIGVAGGPAHKIGVAAWFTWAPDGTILAIRSPGPNNMDTNAVWAIVPGEPAMASSANLGPRVRGSG